MMHPKKSLGQNFLTSVGALNDMINASNVSKGDTVLEIGPGKGALTKRLLETGADVTAVEKDEELVEYLKDVFKSEIESGQLVLVVGDILDLPLDKGGLRGIFSSSYKLIANIPYYITGQIFRMFLESDHQPSSMTILVQKEVAERVVARDGKESILSISVKAYGTPQYISTVKAGSFNPKPNVDSAILHIAHISKSLFQENKVTEKLFFEVLKAGFAHKRKMLVGNLKEKNFILPEHMDQKVRGEDISIAEWFQLGKHQK